MARKMKEILLGSMLGIGLYAFILGTVCCVYYICEFFSIKRKLHEDTVIAEDMQEISKAIKDTVKPWETSLDE